MVELNEPGISAVHDSVLEKLEFGRVLEMLADECRFSVASQLARTIRPSTSHHQVVNDLADTAEAVELATEFPDVVIGGARDVREQIDRVEKGGRLQPAELLDMGGTVAASRHLRDGVMRASGAGRRFPRLEEIASHLIDWRVFEETVSRTVGPSGDVLDTASEALGKIRREMRVAHNRLMDRLNSMVGSGRLAPALQDTIITSRDGRYVLPVKAEARGDVPGVVHDTSSSGQTLFVEPLEIVELNNRWREAQLDELHEIERVLLAVSAMAGERAGELRTTVTCLAELDLLNAKARLSFRMRATQPVMTEAGSELTGGHARSQIALTAARHPLLDPASVVPIDVEIGRSFRVLLITGPNTGGKTVALKTVGLLALMAQSGLFIPARDQSVLSVFDHFFVDIGDEQSIQQSLSTFSSHMRNVIAMLSQVDEMSLVLLDELGAGTDPQEGSALARAVIETLLTSGPLVLATTHYSDVKAFAYETEGVENGSVEFDLATLSPTYRLTIGVPGQSNALAIARRLGMPEPVLQRAEGLVAPEEGRADRLIEQIMRRRNAAEALQLSAELAHKEAVEARAQAVEELRLAEQERHLGRQEAVAAVNAELAEARGLFRQIERERKHAVPVVQPSPHVSKADLDQAATQVRSVAASARGETTERFAEQLKVGDLVHVASLDLDGEVLEVGDSDAEISIGGLRIRQPFVALTRKGRVPVTEQAPVRFRRTQGPAVPMEIDLRGERAADLESQLERYLDGAARSGLPYVRIIHGKGSGALRQEVNRVLKVNPAVLKFQHPPMNEGGDGVTIAWFEPFD